MCLREVRGFNFKNDDDDKKKGEWSSSTTNKNENIDNFITVCSLSSL